MGCVEADLRVVRLKYLKYENKPFGITLGSISIFVRIAITWQQNFSFKTKGLPKKDI